MRDKLIKLIKYCTSCEECRDEDIADHLLANGVIVPPCKVGDTVWLLQKRCKYAGDENKPWENCGQYWDNVCKKEMWGCAGKDDEGHTFPCEKKELVWYAKEMEYSLALYSPNIVQGENLFLTREEAERALKAREKSEHI